MPGKNERRRPRILLTGSNGQVGWSLARSLAPVGEVFAPERAEMDLALPQSIRAAVRSFRPEWIVNPAAYTAVDKAESEPEMAYAVNRDAVAVLAEEARALNAGVVHYSTDYVFDGASATPYLETDATGPLGVYGASKLAGEQALAASGAPHLIFRTSWVYGARGKNFLLTILKLAREREELRVVADQHGAPTWCGDLARITAEAIRGTEARAVEQGCSPAEALAETSGIYHACNSGETTWHGFAAEAVRQMQEREPGRRFASLVPIATAEYPTPARRPQYSLLNCGKLESRLGLRMGEWKRSLAEVVAAL
ncbi:MAG: dTDP-4-dehydrorhamnose reductase [Acidobacteriaceae bacterium]